MWFCKAKFNENVIKHFQSSVFSFECKRYFIINKILLLDYLIITLQNTAELYFLKFN